VSSRLGVVRLVLAAAVLVLVVDACGTLQSSTPRRAASAPQAIPVPVPVDAGLAQRPTTTALVDLPEPVAIPEDSYAPEPVVPYGSMEIPKIALVHPLYEGVTLNNIDKGPSHWPGTAIPGQAGNAVFAGHRVTHDHPFLHIDELVPGDLVIFHVFGVRSVYRVTNSMVVLPEDTWIAKQTPQPTATLYACHPPGSATNRYVVQMALVSTGPEA
jgi:sortase A